MKDLSELHPKIDEVNNILTDYLPSDERDLRDICEAVRYSVLSGGKRLRPIMLLESFRLFNSDKEMEDRLAAPFAAALEFIQAYSLVHDDLPAMDNDMYRRGQLTTHAKFGHAMGILAGDALLNLSFETVNRAMQELKDIRGEYARELYERCVKAGSYIFRLSGYSGMIGGQVLDVNGVTSALAAPLEQQDRIKLKLQLNRLYDLKTAGLFKAALCAGAALGGADSEQLGRIEELGYHIGLAFQIKDDILDITSTTEVLGKEVGSDEKNNKVTMASLLGVEAAQALVREHSEKAEEILESLPGNTAFLKELTLFLVERNK